MSSPLLPKPSLAVIVCVLGITQIIGYGTIYYSYAIIAPRLAATFNVDPTLPFGLLSAALLVSGLLGPCAGRLIDRRGPATVMTVGSVAIAGQYALLAVAPAFAVAGVLVIALQVSAIAVLYTASFPILTSFAGKHARKSITYLTLISGFASTLFWPLTGALIDAYGWRVTFAAFALLHLFVAAPVHLWIARQERRSRLSASHINSVTTANTVSLTEADDRRNFWAVALSFGLTAIVSTSLVVHLVPILEQSGLGRSAYLVSMIIGPSMVTARLAEALLSRRLTPVATAIVASLCFPLALLFLTVGLPPLAGGVLFALLYGCGHGLSVIVGGTVPLSLFGSQGYAEMLGRLNLLRIVLSAGAPGAFAVATIAFGFTPTLVAGIAIGVLAAMPLLVVRPKRQVFA